MNSKDSKEKLIKRRILEASRKSASLEYLRELDEKAGSRALPDMKIHNQ